jgi:hypothetical protein
MRISDLDIKGKLTGFRFDNKGFILEYQDEGVNKQYGSTSKSEMSEFAGILAEELRPKEGVVE